MKQLLTIFLTVTILSQSLVQVGVMVYYHINKAYITQKLCENRNTPDLHCNGQCYLSKQLKKAEEGERKQAQSIVKEKDEIIPRDKRVTVAALFPVLNTNTFNPYRFTFSVPDYRNALIKPPAV